MLFRERSFNLIMPGNEGQGLYYRTHFSFTFPDKVTRPSLDVEFSQLPVDVQERIKPWCDKAIAFRILRDELRSRVDALLDWGWKSCQVWDANRGSWRGGPTPGQGCNTVGQVARLWPELLAFFPPDEVAVVRNSKARSRLPEHIAGYGTIPALRRPHDKPLPCLASGFIHET